MQRFACLRSCCSALDRVEQCDPTPMPGTGLPLDRSFNRRIIGTHVGADLTAHRQLPKTLPVPHCTKHPICVFEIKFAACSKRKKTKHCASDPTHPYPMDTNLADQEHLPDLEKNWSIGKSTLETDLSSASTGKTPHRKHQGSIRKLEKAPLTLGTNQACFSKRFSKVFKGFEKRFFKVLGRELGGRWVRGSGCFEVFSCFSSFFVKKV